MAEFLGFLIALLAFIIPINSCFILSHFDAFIGKGALHLSLSFAAYFLIQDVVCAVTYCAVDYLTEERFKKLKICAPLGCIFSLGVYLITLHSHQVTWWYQAFPDFLPVGLYLCIIATSYLVQVLATLTNARYLDMLNDWKTLIPHRVALPILLNLLPLLEMVLESLISPFWKHQPTFSFVAVAMFVAVNGTVAAILFLTRNETNADSLALVCFPTLWFLSMLTAQFILINPLTTIGAVFLWCAFERFRKVHDVITSIC